MSTKSLKALGREAEGNGNKWASLGLTLETDLGPIERTREGGVSKWPVADLEIGHAVTGDLKTVRNIAVAGRAYVRKEEKAGRTKPEFRTRKISADKYAYQRVG